LHDFIQDSARVLEETASNSTLIRSQSVVVLDVRVDGHAGLALLEFSLYGVRAERVGARDQLLLHTRQRALVSADT
jgi:hypothetical protein